MTKVYIELMRPNWHASNEPTQDAINNAYFTKEEIHAFSLYHEVQSLLNSDDGRPRLCGVSRQPVDIAPRNDRGVQLTYIAYGDAVDSPFVRLMAGYSDWYEVDTKDGYIRFVFKSRLHNMRVHWYM